MLDKVRSAVVAVLVAPIRLYQLVHPYFFHGVCRFQPTCSSYAIEALRVHGLFQWVYLAVFRFLSCNPFCKGGYDPVPPRKEKT